MPRVTECLSARQEIQEEDEEPITEAPEYEEYTDQYDVDYVDDYNEYVASKDIENTSSTGGSIIQTRNGETNIINETIEDTTEAAFLEEDYDDTEPVWQTEDNIVFEGDKEDALTVLLEEDGLKEEKEVEEIEEVDVNIDEGLLIDNKGNTVDLPTKVNTPTVRVPLLFGFLIIGGTDPTGDPVSFIQALSDSLRNLSRPLSVPSLPSSLGDDTTTSYSCSTSCSLISCGTGITTLSPYGYLFSVGSCMSHSLGSKSWGGPNAELNSYRKGASIARVGRYLVASGGRRNGRGLSTMEVFDNAKPRKGWKRMGHMRLPASVSDHCSVSLGSSQGELVMIGGRNREDRVLKLSIKENKWFSLHRPNVGRRLHACTKARINGRPGILVSGGVSGNSSSVLTSVEFFDLETGSWMMLPNMRKGRSKHVMTVSKGRVMVAGGETRDRQGRQVVLDDVEVFTGNRWALGRQKMEVARSGFSLVRVPMYRLRGARRPDTQDNRNGRRNVKNRKEAPRL